MSLLLVGMLALSVLLQLAVLALELPHRRRRRAHDLKRDAVDEGIALAERMARAHGCPKDLKLATAISHAREQLGHARVRTTDAELRKLVELRLERSAQ